MNKNSPMPRTIVQEITLHNRRALATHPVIEKLLSYKWDTFAYMYHMTEVAKYLTFLLLWTAVAFRQPFYYCTGEEGTVSAHCETTTYYSLRSDYSDNFLKADALLPNGTNSSSAISSDGNDVNEGVVWLVVECVALFASGYYLWNEIHEYNFRGKIARFHTTFALQALDHISLGLTDRYGARFSTEIYTRACHCVQTLKRADV
jgi:hypothetical protein